MENRSFLFRHNLKATGKNVLWKISLWKNVLGKDLMFSFLHVLNVQLREDNILVLWRGVKSGADGL